MECLLPYLDNVMVIVFHKMHSWMECWIMEVLDYRGFNVLYFRCKFHSVHNCIHFVFDKK